MKTLIAIFLLGAMMGCMNVASARRYKLCKNCGEEIKASAIKCRYCGALT